MNKEEIRNQLIRKNSNIANTLNNEFLSDRILSRFPMHVIEYCANYENVQEEFLKLNDTLLNVLSKIINKAINENNDWISIGAKFIRTVNNQNYEELFTNLNGRELNDVEIENLLFLTNPWHNFFEVKTYEDLSNINEILNKKRTHETKDPNYILLSKYGLSYDTAYSYLQRFGRDLDKLPNTKEKEILEDIKTIIEGKETTKEFEDYDFINNIDSNLRNMFVRIYNDKLYKLSSDKLLGTYFMGEKEIELYDAGTDFVLSIYSLGLASGITQVPNYYLDWNRDNVTNPNFCNSIVTEKSIRTKVKQCVYGFDSFGLNEIKLLASNDLGTNGSITQTPDITYLQRKDKLIADVDFRIPEEIINNTRFTNNELYRSRMRIENGSLKRINPSYLVYFKNESNTDVTNDSIWHETLKASIDFSINGKPLPIVIVDCEKCLGKNSQQIEEMILQFENMYDNPTFIKRIIEQIYTIKFGYRNNLEVLDRYLSDKKQIEYFHRLIKHIKDMSKIVPNMSLETINNFIDSMDEEYKKMLASEHWIRQSNDGKLIDKNPFVYETLESVKKEIEEVINSRNQTFQETKKEALSI